LTDFRSVNTAAARYQQLSLNPQKLAGQCGKLKCCLNFELDTYLDALDGFPKSDVKLATEKGMAVCQKTDIFKGLLWYAYEKEGMNWHQLSLENVKEIIAVNKKGNKVASLEEFIEEVVISDKEIFSSVVGQDSITRFDKPKRSNKRRSNKGNQRNQNRSNNESKNTSKASGNSKNKRKNNNRKRKPQSNAK
jgi:hypothetical protein